MKKLFAHLSLLCLLALLLVPFVGCKKDEPAEETVTTETSMEPMATEPMSTEPMSTMTTDTMSTEPMSSGQ